MYIHHGSTHVPTCSSQHTRSPSWHPRTHWAAQSNPESWEGHLHPQRGPARSALGPCSCSTSGEGWTHGEEGVAAPAPCRLDTDTRTSLHQEREQQHHGTPQYCRTYPNTPGCVDAMGGWQDMVPSPPASIGHSAVKTKGKLRHDSPVGHPPLDTLQPCLWPCPQCQGRGGHRRPPQPVLTRLEWPQSQRGGVAPPADTQSLNWSHWVPPPPGRLRRGTAPRAGPARTCTGPWGQGRAGGAPPHPDPRGSPRQLAPQGTHVAGNRHGNPHHLGAGVRRGPAATPWHPGKLRHSEGCWFGGTPGGSPPPAAPSCRHGRR